MVADEDDADVADVCDLGAWLTGTVDEGAGRCRGAAAREESQIGLTDNNAKYSGNYHAPSGSLAVAPIR